MIRKGLLVIVLVFGLGAQAQRNTNVNELFYLGANAAYSSSGELWGANGKFSFPMQKGFNFVMQGTLFPSQLNKQYEEFRYEFNVEMIPFSIGRFSPFLQVGFNYGYWRRKNTIVGQGLNTDGVLVKYEVEPRTKFFKDESMLFGAGLNYQLKRWIIYGEYKYYPNLSNYHTGLGIKLLFFENKIKRQLYYLQRKRRKSSKS